MDILKIDLENCYGINKLHTDFDFSKERAYALYAPNGVMKTSLAKTFRDITEKKKSKDLIFPERISNRKVTDENGYELQSENILVISPYDEYFDCSEKTATLLVDNKLRQEYEKLYVEIDKTKEYFLKALRDQSGSKVNIEKEISSTFTNSDDQFFEVLLKIKNEILFQNNAPFSFIQYDKLFDEKIINFLGLEDVKNALEQYIKKYNELLNSSIYFKKGTFNYFNATTIGKSLNDNGFFKANHSVILNANDRLEITSQKQLSEIITKEKEKISQDKELRNKFDDLEKLISKNAILRDFQNYLSEHEEVLPNLANIRKFKQDVWKSYFISQVNLFKDLLDKYQSSQKRKIEIEQVAAHQHTQWESVIENFNKRFFVPFTLSIKNRISVVLGQEPVPNLAFVFKDEKGQTQVEKSSLIEALSTGEKRAFYLLYIIFEIEARKKNNQETIFIIDDIADSFDYKNKYAIIQYLYEISKIPNFYQIILTHNYDFYRTIHYRFVKYSNCLMAMKSDNSIEINQAKGIRNIFVNDWKNHFFDDLKKKIASIPFIRNIIEYISDEDDDDYIKLTSLLHYKNDSDKITLVELDKIFKNNFIVKDHVSSSTESVLKIIDQEAKKCLLDSDCINLENKIVLSIAIRIRSEKYMIEKISDPEFVVNIKTNQTRSLFEKYIELFPDDKDQIDTIHSVILMTPENIHLNSFMYEPIIDMSNDHLKRLYKDVLKLK